MPASVQNRMLCHWGIHVSLNSSSWGTYPTGVSFDSAGSLLLLASTDHTHHYTTPVLVQAFVHFVHGTIIRKPLLYSSTWTPWRAVAHSSSSMYVMHARVEVLSKQKVWKTNPGECKSCMTSA